MGGTLTRSSPASGGFLIQVSLRRGQAWAAAWHLVGPHKVIVKALRMPQLVVNMWVEGTRLPGRGIELARRVASKDVLSGPAVTQQSDTDLISALLAGPESREA